MTSLKDVACMNVPELVLPAPNTAQVSLSLQEPDPPSVHYSDTLRRRRTKCENPLKSWDQTKADLNAEISAARKQLNLHDHCLNIHGKAEKSQVNMLNSDLQQQHETSMEHHRKPQKEHLVNLQIGKVKLQLHPPAQGKKQVLFVKYRNPPEAGSAVDATDPEIEPPGIPHIKPPTPERDGSSLTESGKEKGADRNTERSFKICLTNVPDESCSSSDAYFDIAKCIRNEKFPEQTSEMSEEDSTDDSDDDDDDGEEDDDGGIEKKGDEKLLRIPVSWREMIKTYSCKICVFQSHSVRLACQHLLVEHVDIVEPLGDFLSSKTVANSNQSLYGYILENLPPISRRNTAEGWELEGEYGGASLPSQWMQAGQNAGNIVEESSVGGNENESNCHQNDGEVDHPNLYQEKDSVGLLKYSQDCAAGDFSQEKSEEQEKRGESCSGKQVSFIKPCPRESILLETQELISLLRKWMKVYYQCPRCHVKMYYMKMTSYHHCHRTCRTVLCHGCGKYFSSRVYFQHYQRVHITSKKTAVCKFCKKEMASYLLSNHVKQHHSGPREIYQCGICGRQLGSRQHLGKHEMIHRTEKPYKCSVCQRGFTQRTNMKNHMRQHTGEQPYKCEKCGKSFTHNVSLKNHLKRYHGIDLFKENHTGGGRRKIGRPKKNKL